MKELTGKTNIQLLWTSYSVNPQINRKPYENRNKSRLSVAVVATSCRLARAVVNTHL